MEVETPRDRDESESIPEGPQNGHAADTKEAAEIELDNQERNGRTLSHCHQVMA